MITGLGRNAECSPGLDAGSPDLYACFLSAISLVRRHFSETDDVEAKTGLKLKMVFDLDSEEWECHLSCPSSTNAIFESGPFAGQDHATCWVAFVACRELKLGFPSIGIATNGQPTDAQVHVGEKLMKMLYAIEGFVNLPLSDEGKLTKRRIDKLYIGRIYSCLAVGTFLSKGSRSAYCVMRFVKKSVACAYYRGGFRLALAVTSGIIGPMVGIATWEDFALKYHQPPIPRTYMRFPKLELSKIEGTLGYNFGGKAVLVESLVHESFPGELKMNFNYERLEFLGDTVVEFLAALYFLERNQQISDQKLSKVASHSTSNAALGALCIELKYHSHLRHRKLERHIAQGIRAFSSKKPWPCYWVRLSIPKVCFADIIESAFGAAFLDSGFDLEAPRDVFDKIVRPFYNKNFIRV
ncbi:Dicer-like protein 1 [Mortierella sp. AD011]|nr:Dicer-like protein 1 [Mortierella sp. AD010]KAF9400116.1 Dicer-like protein 1 [Mortierella sp. AD011]